MGIRNDFKNIGEEIGKKEIPKRISMEQVSLAEGPPLSQVEMEKQTIKEAYQKFTVNDSKVECVSGESIFKGTDNLKFKNVGEYFNSINNIGKRDDLTEACKDSRSICRIRGKR
ncbi:hypothetical protein [Peribacillus frigoritolerans]|uniref:hypothetical protein n=1 Tax=Peribacillus frigoritolerans TaxID=450367 RepID=UPI0039A04E8A